MIENTGTTTNRANIGIGNLGGNKMWYLGTDANPTGPNNSNNFYIYQGSSSTYKFVIDPIGNVGLGTTTPGYKLEVAGSALVSGNNEGFVLKNTASANKMWDISSHGNDMWFNETGVLTRLTLQAGGNVGIGTTAPRGGLEINNTSTTGWSANNYGTNLLIGGANNNSIGIFDNAGNNPLAITNEAGNFRVSAMPALGNTTTSPNNLLSILANGYVGIGTGTPGAKLHVVTNIADYAASIQNNNNTAGGLGLIISAGSNTVGGASLLGFYRPDGVLLGAITQNGTTSVSYNTTSDRRLKNNIVNTHFGITDLMKIQVRDYVYKADKSNTLNTGFIAQELYEIFPNAVTKPAKAEDMWSVDYGKVTPLLVKAIQDLKNENELLKAANATSEANYKSLKAEVDALKSLITGQKVTGQK